MLRIAVAGASGRMGRMLIDAVVDAPDLRLTAALDRPDSAVIGAAARGDLHVVDGIIVGCDIPAGLAVSDVLIDFTRPEATLVNLAACMAQGVGMVIGTTGFDAAGRDTITAAAERIAIVFAPNMSVGVNVLFKLIADATRALSTGYDIEIIEAHHRHKVDAPSGTAVRIGEIVADAVGVALADVASYGREGLTGPRDPSTIGFSTIRGGDIVGDHTVLYAGIGERIEITHRASSRAGYAAGSLLAARFLADRRSGLFDMQDVLGLR
ncbi:MAG: 4-hydroxy-tetrahydrodipicolinate reductase [Burkholderiaceae bacterium]